MTEFLYTRENSLNLKKGHIGIVEKEQETSWNVAVDVSWNAETSPHHTA